MPRDDTQAAGAGHNAGSIEGPTRAQFLAYYREEAEIEGQIAQAQARRKKLRRQMRADGVILGDYDAAKRLFGKEEGEQRSYFANVQGYLEWLGVPVGTQFSFAFDAAAAPGGEEDDEARAARLIAKARAAGVQAGVRGDDPQEAPYGPETPAGQAWLEGFHEAQALAVMERIRVRERLDAPEDGGGEDDDAPDEDDGEDQEDDAPPAAPKRRGRPRRAA